VLKKYFLLPAVLILFSLNCVSAFAADELEIIYKDGLLTVSADNVIPEKIFLELGQVCNIDIITHGNVFPEKGVSLKLKDMPIKEAVKRLVRTCALKNYLMDFKKDPQGQSQLVKIDLYMGGTGQRYLTQGRGKSGQKAAGKKVKTEKNTRSDSVDKQKSTRSDSADKQKKNKMPYKSSFSKDTDFVWDGSAPIAFPEYKGEIAYDQSEATFDDSAKEFSEKTMDMVPPGVRDMVSEQIIKMSDQIAKERGTDTITSDITAEAMQRIAKQANMPPQVMDLMPESMDDFDRAKIPIDSDQMQEDYRN
jgi:hypothetical protein